MTNSLTAYGLDENPYALRELDPVNQPHHEQLLVPVDGFGLLAQIENQLGNPKDQARFMIVLGRSGTGRSSVANYLVHRWAKLHGYESAKLIVRRQAMLHYNSPELIWEWILYLRNEIEGKKIALQESLQQKYQTLEAGVPSAPGPVFERILVSTRTELERRGYIFAGVFEQAKSADLIDGAVRAFSKSGALVVITVDDIEPLATEVRDATNSLISKPGLGGLIELTPLLGREVRILVEERWRQRSQTQSPFDAQGLEEAFVPPRPIARALSVIATMLELKQAEFPAGFRWPDHVQLGFSRQEIGEKLRIIDGTLGGVRS